MEPRSAAASSPEGAGPGGLSEAEARRRLRAFGPNRLVERHRWEWLRDLLRLVSDPMAIMLAIAGAVYLLLGEVKDGVILLAAIAPVLGVDVLLEARSRAALKKLAAAVSLRARVLRDGAEREIPREEIVPGDLLLLREGDLLHADGVVRRAANLTLDESQLTGESEPVRKEAVPAGAPPEPADAGHAFFAGSLVLTGQGIGEVTRTGPRTRFGRIAHLVAEAVPAATPLQRKTRRMFRVLGLAAVAVAVLVFLLGLWRGGDVYHALLTALSVAIASVPEEFPLVFTIFLSMGAFRLSRRGVLVRRLAAVETLGSTTVICTDKTGTLTAGRFALDAHEVLSPRASEDALLEAAVLACEPEPADTMERAIAAHCGEHGLRLAPLLAAWQLVHDHDFDAVGKHMSHVWRRAEGGAEPWRLCAKGALEGILEHCRLAAGERARAEAANAALAAKGMRVLAVAERRSAHMTGVRQEDEAGLELLGLLGFRDPLRPEVPAAVEECGRAGIRVKLVTGDHPLTAHAIADAAGIPHADQGVVTGDELDALPPDARAERIRTCAIFARVRPEQKHAIVEALSRAGEVVAMTGDGLNDAPALRRADIGVSFGIRGTPVARAAADLVLLDDDFAALVATVREGRAIYANIQRAFLYLLSFKLRVAGLALLVPLVGLPALFQPVHLVWLELIVHPVSALVFEAEPPPPDLMRRAPRDPRAPLVPGRLAARSLASGAILMIAALWAYAAHLSQGVAYARSLGVAVVIAGSLLQVWAERAGDGPPWSAPLPRTWRFWGVWGGVALSLPLFMHVPAIAGIFQIVPLQASDWALVLAVSAASVAWRALPRRRR
ncbi:cation-translocating P-type ATPase [Anaeromyxobacter oryzisoli]|uniref:cation-translocating P-type ATPase n=1 Tax=Anaeromyxobacter oryzisoli TaxID=2925408 RepID=UPI001F574DEC|nr:cation-transporting P-type ATPase [Anaeromyxobacter sp. SG63]